MLETKTVYSFTKDYLIYFGQIDYTADWRLPGLIGDYSTLIPIPEYSGPEIPQFDKEAQSWKVIPDYRFVGLYYKKDGSQVPCDLTVPGVTPESLDAVTVAPPFPSGYHWDDATSTWVADDPTKIPPGVLHNA